MMRRRNSFGEFWDEMSKIQRDMSHFFAGPESRPKVGVYPSLNVYDEGESFVVRAEIPGIDPKNLEIEATADSLTIKGERNRPSTEDSGSSHRREREWGTFSRTLTLGMRVSPDKIKAEYKLGILKVILPKAPEALPRKVSIEAA